MSIDLDSGPIPCPPPGVYTGIPMEEYRRWDALCYSLLAAAYPGGDRAVLSMRRLKAALDGRIATETPAMRFGTAVHLRLLEPARFIERFPIARPCAGVVRSKTAKNPGGPCGAIGQRMYRLGDDWFCCRHAPEGAEETVDFLDRDQAEAIEEMVSELKKRDIFRLFKRLGGVETCYVADMRVDFSVDGEQASTVVRLKCRVDKDGSEWKASDGSPLPTFVDLKKVRPDRHADWAFNRYYIHPYLYDLQAALYTDIAAAVDGRRRRWIWLPIEDSYPFDHNAIRATPAMLSAGRQAYRRALEAYCACRWKEDRQPDFDWPGPYSGIHESPNPWWLEDER